MKKHRLVEIVLILIIFTISSCTLTKRHYQPGYHVEWHIGNKGSNNQPEKVIDAKLLSVKKMDPNCMEIDQPVLIASDNSYQNIDYSIKSGLITQDIGTQNLTTISTKQDANSNSQMLGKKSFAKTDYEEPVIHWTAGAALGLGILGFIVPFFPCIAAIILGAIALSKINSEPEKYRGSGLAIAGIILGVLGLVFIIGLVVLMFMAFL